MRGASHRALNAPFFQRCNLCSCCNYIIVVYAAVQLPSAGAQHVNQSRRRRYSFLLSLLCVFIMSQCGARCESCNNNNRACGRRVRARVFYNVCCPLTQLCVRHSSASQWGPLQNIYAKVHSKVRQKKRVKNAHFLKDHPTWLSKWT